MFSTAPKPSLIKRLIGVLYTHKWVAILAICSVYQFGTGGYIYAKAAAAQWLIKDAWQDTLKTRQTVKPWAWADTWPVAKLTIQNRQLYVLSGASGRNLAFGPAHLSHTPKPGEPGNVAIAGHRDTHFDVLRELEKGDLLHLEGVKQQKSYRVTNMRIVHESQVEVLNSSRQDEITLITCYPFDSLGPNTPLRYVVQGRLDDSKDLVSL